MARYPTPPEGVRTRQVMVRLNGPEYDRLVRAGRLTKRPPTALARDLVMREVDGLLARQSEAKKGKPKPARAGR